MTTCPAKAPERAADGVNSDPIHAARAATQPPGGMSGFSGAAFQTGVGVFL